MTKDSARSNPLAALNGWKTEIGIVASLLVGLLSRFEIIDDAMYGTLMAVTLSFTGVSLKHAIRKAGGN